MRTFKTDILVDMRPGETVKLELPNTEECSTYSALAWRYNKLKGKSQGKYIHTSINYDECEVFLVCTTYDDYQKEKNKQLPREWWKQLITKKAFPNLTKPS